MGTEHPNWYLVRSVADDASIAIDRTWLLEHAARLSLCSNNLRCWNAEPPAGPFEPKLGRRAKGSIDGSWGLVISHIAVDAILADHVPGYRSGVCVDQRGRPTEYRAWRGSRFVRKRGKPPRMVTRCPGCGVLRAYPDVEPNEDLLLREIEGVHAAQTLISGSLVISETLARDPRWRRIDDLWLAPLPVRERPADGLRFPGDPPEWPGIDAASIARIEE